MVLFQQQRRLVVFLCALVILGTAQEATWGGCVNKGLLKKVRIGAQSRVCLQIGNGVNWAEGVQYVRASFEPVADEYSYYHVPNSYRDLVNTAGLFRGKNITVGTAAQTKLSFLRMYYDTDKQRIYPYLTAIMDVKKGDITGITWDDACLFCGDIDGQCEENTYSFTGVQQTSETAEQKTKSCYVTKAECDQLLADNPENPACDLKVYTVWTGTDVDGKALQSQAFRFSEFPVQKLTDRFTQLLPGFLKGFAAGGESENNTVTDL